VDGAVYTRDFRADNGVGLQVNAFIGSNEVRTQVITTAGNSIRAFRGSVLKGGQLWLSIPQGETRVSGYFAHYRNDQPTTFGKRHEMLASIESHPLPRTTLRAEGLRIYGYGLTYRIGGGALVRLERHEVTGYAFDAPVPFLATTGANSVVAPGSYGAYWLASFAVSF
jgi:hypothetical protein